MASGCRSGSLPAAEYVSQLVDEPLERIRLPLARGFRRPPLRPGNVELYLAVDPALAQSLLEHVADDR